MEKDVSRVDKAAEGLLALPQLSPQAYRMTDSQTAIKPDDKVIFLQIYFNTGNLTRAAIKAGFKFASFARHMDTDPAFRADYEAVRLALKHNLEQVMYENGLTTKGYMDRITWLRKNYPNEYVPDKLKEGSSNPTADALKQLASKLKDYQLIPKDQIINTENLDATTAGIEPGSEESEHQGIDG